MDILVQTLRSRSKEKDSHVIYEWVLPETLIKEWRKQDKERTEVKQLCEFRKNPHFSLVLQECQLHPRICFLGSCHWLRTKSREYKPPGSLYKQSSSYTLGVVTESVTTAAFRSKRTQKLGSGTQKWLKRIPEGSGQRAPTLSTSPFLSILVSIFYTFVFLLRMHTEVLIPSEFWTSVLDQDVNSLMHFCNEIFIFISCSLSIMIKLWFR